MEKGLQTVYLATESAPYSRLFGLDLQLLVDACITALAVFVLFIGLSYLLFNPTRDFLKKRKEKIQNDMESAAKEKADASKLKEEYDGKLKEIHKEAETILSDTRKKALQQERDILEEAREEAVCVRNRANKEIELEKSKVKDEVKQEMIAIASAMAGKIVATSIDERQQADLIEETLKEMGDSTWQS